jgi:hypothetical protein
MTEQTEITEQTKIFPDFFRLFRYFRLFRHLFFLLPMALADTRVLYFFPAYQ